MYTYLYSVAPSVFSTVVFSSALPLARLALLAARSALSSFFCAFRCFFVWGALPPSQFFWGGGRPPALLHPTLTMQSTWTTNSNTGSACNCPLHLTHAVPIYSLLQCPILVQQNRRITGPYTQQSSPNYCSNGNLVSAP